CARETYYYGSSLFAYW
nr:immunoglobulin heavy chain junction region [Mus musculus]